MSHRSLNEMAKRNAAMHNLSVTWTGIRDTLRQLDAVENRMDTVFHAASNYTAEELNNLRKEIVAQFHKTFNDNAPTND